MARSTRRLTRASLEAAAEQACAARGLRLTPLRFRAYEILAGSDTPMKAYELLDSLGAPGDPAHPNTAYRALEFLEAAGLVHRIEALNAYVACSGCATDGASSLFICETCNTVREVASPVGAQSAPEGFRVRRSVLEHFGECGACRGVAE